MKKSHTRRRTWRTPLAVFAALAVAALAGLYIAVATLDVEQYRESIESLVSRSLDREVRIGGAIALERSLAPRFVVEDVSVANPPWASRPLLASAKRLEVRVALVPLLSRRLEIVELHLVGADVWLERRRDGTPNWVFGRKADAPGDAGMAAEVLAFGAQRSTLVYRHTDGEEVEVLIDTLATTFAPGRPIPLHFKGRYQQIPVELQIDGGTLDDFLSPTTSWSFRGKAALGGLYADINGSATEPFKLAGVDMAVRFQGTRAGGIRSILTEHVPQLAEYRGAGRFSSGAKGFGFEVQAQGSEIELTSLWSGRDANPVFAVNAQRIELTGRGTAPTLSTLLTRASWQLRARGAELRWRHGDAKSPLVLSNIEATAAVTDGGPIAVDVRGSYAGKPLIVRATLGSLATLMAVKTPWTIEVAAESSGARGELRGAFLKPLTSAQLAATFRADAARLDTLGEFSGIALPTAGPTRIAGKLTTLAGGRIQLSALDINVAESRLRGAVDWQRTSVPHVTIKVAPSRIRVEDLRQTTNTAVVRRAERDAADDGRVIPDIAIVGDLPRQTVFDVSFDRLELTHANAVLASLTGGLRLADGRLVLGPLRSTVGDATINAKVVLDASVVPAQIGAEIDARSIDYGALMNVIEVTDGGQGRIDLRVRLTGYGNSLRPLLSTASGWIEVVGGEGRMRGRLLELWSGNLVQILNPVVWAKGGDSELNCIAAQFDLSEGSARSRTLLADSRSVTVAGEVAVNLRTEQIDGLFTPHPKEATLVYVGTPLKLSGTLKDPKVAPADLGPVSLGRFAIGLVRPTAVLGMFKEMAAKEKNPCAALIARLATGAPAGAREDR